MKSKDKGTVVVFDIRNFSAHRYHLGLRENARAGLVKDVIQDLLNDAVKLLGNDGPHLLNYTGDGFVLVIRGPGNQLKAIDWISRFRERASERMKKYEDELERLFPSVHADLKSLDFGIGAHFGIVRSFEFTGFGKEPQKAFIGSAVNVASRVEQFTKEYGYRVICTGRVFDSLKDSHRARIKEFAKPLGSQRLRGFPEPYELYSLKAGFHKQGRV